MSDRAVAAIAVGVTVGVAIAVSVRRRPVEYVLHVYDHCPFCNRVEWLMQRHGLAYRRVLYGYGAGARPDKCDGHGYGEGPLHLTGQKMLPVLEGPGVPCSAGRKGLPESMEICAFLIGQHKLVVPCESGRTDLKRFTQELTELKPALCEHRMVRMAPHMHMHMHRCAHAQVRTCTGAHAD